MVITRQRACHACDPASVSAVAGEANFNFLLENYAIQRCKPSPTMLAVSTRIQLSDAICVRIYVTKNAK